MVRVSWRLWILATVIAGGVVGAFWLSPIAQDPTYHEFSDRRALAGIPNFWNVFSNLPFVLVGAFGLTRAFDLSRSASRTAYLILCIGVIFVGFGSAYYHYGPSTSTLLWDRLPMAVAFMALFSLVVSDRVSERLGGVMLWPLIFAGVASVGYWYWSELQGRGDLRAYGVVQFLPVVLIPLMLLLYRGQGLSAPLLWGTLVMYALAKSAEHFDQIIYESIRFLSGHSLKHLLAAIAVLWAVISVPQSNYDEP